jgi:polar amino acid transport system substrate-binding protein
MTTTKKTADYFFFILRFLSCRGLFRVCTVCGLMLTVGPTIAQDATGKATWERILQSKSIRVGTIGTANTSKVNLDGTFTGHSPEVLRQALAPSGVTKLVPVQMEFASLIPALLANRIDVIANTMSIRKARCAQVAFGNPDLNTRGGFAVLKGNPKNLHSFADVAKNKDAKIGWLDGGFQGKFAEIAGIPKERQLTFPDNVAVVGGVQTGRIDAGTMPRVQLVGYLKALNDPNLELAEPYYPPLNASGQPDLDLVGAAFRKEDNELREAYNRGLAELIASGKLLAIIKEQTGGNEEDMPTAGMTAEKFCAERD